MARKKIQKNENKDVPPPKPIDVIYKADGYSEYTSGSRDIMNVSPKSGSTATTGVIEKTKRKSTQADFSSSSSDSLDSSRPETITPEILQAKKKRAETQKKKLLDNSRLSDKPSNWLTMSKRQRENYIAKQKRDRMQRLEEARNERKKKLRLDALERNELAKEESIRQDIRKDLLMKTCLLFKKHIKLREEHDFRDIVKVQWKVYVKCDGTPDPVKPTFINDYLSQWQGKSYHTCTDDDLAKRFKTVVSVLNIMEMIMTKKWFLPPESVKNIKEARFDLRLQLLEAIDCTCYNLLRDVAHNLKFITPKTSTYHRSFKDLNLNLCVAVRPPPSDVRKEEESEAEPNVTFNFKHLKLSVALPNIINSSDLSVRVARNFADLYSPFCKTFELDADAPDSNEDLFTYAEKEYEICKKLKAECEEIVTNFYRETDAKIRVLEKKIRKSPFDKLDEERAELEELQMAEPPLRFGMQNPRTCLQKENSETINDFLVINYQVIGEDEINLRKYRIIGGVLQLNLFETPPQIKYLRDGRQLSTLPLPKAIQEIPFYIDYKPPNKATPVGDTRSKELINMEKEENEAKREMLIEVVMGMWDQVIWLEHPVVCQYDPEKNCWTVENVFEVEFDMENFSIQFKLGRLWPIGFAVRKYCNLPYKNWEMAKDPNGKGVLFTIQCVYVTVTILCRKRTVVLKSISFHNTPKEFQHFNKYINKAMTVQNLKHIFQDLGVDIFPECDSHNYVDGSCIKNWVVERHTYHAMAFLSMAYDFKWSKWNKKSGVRNLIFQMKEHIYTETKFKLMLVTPEACTYLKGDENMKPFSREPANGMKFYPDLFTFNISYGSMDARRSAFELSYKLTETVFELLQEIKPLSFS